MAEANRPAPPARDYCRYHPAEPRCRHVLVGLRILCALSRNDPNCDAKVALKPETFCQLPWLESLHPDEWRANNCGSSR
jgi:hypothetical protein